VRKQVDVELPQDALDVVDGKLGVPAVVEVHCQWPQTALLAA